MGQVNTSREEDGFSIPAQLGAGRDRARFLDAAVEEEYVDRGESARSANRPELQRMLRDLAERRDIDYVIVHKIDRLARNRADDIAINLAIREAGARLISVSENIDDTPSGRLMYGIMADFAEYYSANLGHEMSKKMAEKARQGETPFKAPLGYLNVREIVDFKSIRTVAVDEERADLIRWAFVAYASGEYTITQLHQELVTRGLTTRPTARNGGRPIARSFVGTLLRNRYYLGLVSYAGVEYPGRHAPLVSQEVFDTVQDLLDANRQGEKQRTHPHYLRSTIICARCGGRLCFGRSRSHTGTYYEYFFCINRQMRRAPCTLPNLRVEEIEDRIIEWYANLRLDTETQRRILEKVDATLTARSEERQAEIKRQQRRLARLELERDKLLQLHYHDALPVEKIASEQRRITDEANAAQRALAAATLDIDRLRDNLDTALDALADPQTCYRNSGPRGRRQANRAFFDHIAVDIDQVVYARVSEPYATLTMRDLVNALESEESTNPGHLQDDQGSRKTTMVAGAGFEPATFGL